MSSSGDRPPASYDDDDDDDYHRFSHRSSVFLGITDIDLERFFFYNNNNNFIVCGRANVNNPALHFLKSNLISITISWADIKCCQNNVWFTPLQPKLASPAIKPSSTLSCAE